MVTLLKTPSHCCARWESCKWSSSVFYLSLISTLLQFPIFSIISFPQVAKKCSIMNVEVIFEKLDKSSDDRFHNCLRRHHRHLREVHVFKTEFVEATSNQVVINHFPAALVLFPFLATSLLSSMSSSYIASNDSARRKEKMQLRIIGQKWKKYL